MTVMKTNFEPVSNMLQVQTRDFVLADGTLADPSNAVCLVDGEWMGFDSTGKIVRASAIGTLNNVATGFAWPLWAERGRTDIQAMGSRKAPLLWLGQWEFDTRIFDATATAGSGLAITAIGQCVKVATIAIGSRNYTGLVGKGTADTTAIVVGYVVRLPANNGGKLRVRGGMLY